ncbi:hypothetical protein G0U57_017421 [Chelydra serpentina]|uniref:Uncharacterized protein n=1 Tax=Chelydra serpentina TaxID=8475 RepID=A0A8T1T033_CHESE|nr:hypothetical protein G0U57_017421 [Chelydra serpentina]
MGGDVSHKSHDSTVINMEVTAMEEEECIEEEVESSDPSDVDDMLMEDGEDKEWFLKGNCLSHLLKKQFVNILPFFKNVKGFHVKSSGIHNSKTEEKETVLQCM